MRRLHTSIFCIIVLLALALALPVSAQDPVIVRVAPATLDLAVGATSDVAVEVVEVTGLYGFDVQLSFDPDVVEVVDVDPNTAGVQVSLGRMLDSGMSVRDSADNATGTIHYAMTQINPSEAKSGTGNLIVIRLRGKVTGTTNLTITSVDLARRDATAIPTSPRPGVVTVQAGASTQPTNTPIPTQAPPTPIPTALPESTSQSAQAQPAATATPTALAAATPTQPPSATPTPLAQSPTEPPAASGQTQATDRAPTVADTTVAASTPAGGDVTEPTADAGMSAATPEPAEQQPALAASDPTATPQAIAAAPDAGSNGADAADEARQAEAQTSRSPEQTLLSVGVIALLIAGALALVLGVMVVTRRRAGGQ